MAQVYISFLGTTDYLECHYCGGGFETAKPVRFVQEATIMANCEDWGPDDRVLVFTTEDAEKKNWRDNGHMNPKTRQIKEQEGLESCLAKLALSVPFFNRTIPEGHTEDQVWEIFQSVFDELKAGDEVVFDITHAFRSIPLLAIVILQYAKILKRVSLKGIYYGAFEALGSRHHAEGIPIQNRKAPLVDLTALNSLMDWSIATDRFLESGDVKSAGTLARKGVQDILKVTRGGDKTAQAIRNLGASLEQFSRMLATCRGPEISSTARDLVRKADICGKVDLPRPFRPLFEKIRERLKGFTGSDLKNGLAAARWCADHNLIQQGYTILAEILLSHVVSGVGQNPLEKSVRSIASHAFATVIGEASTSNIESDDKPKADSALKSQMTQFILSHRGLDSAFQKIRPKRNDLNHAGFREERILLRNADSFADSLHALIAEIEQATQDPLTVLPSTS